MFGKKCPSCGSKINSKQNFCSICGISVRGEKEKEDWGLLGKDDFTPFGKQFEEMMPSGFNVLFNSLVNNLERQIKNMERDAEKNIQKETAEKNGKIPEDKINKQGISISISSFSGHPPEIKVTTFGHGRGKSQVKPQNLGLKSFGNLNLENFKKFSKLPREEPKTTVRRFSDRVAYEVEMPGVESLKDVSVIRLENSIEIKAVAKDKTYSKIIPITLPIVNYNFSEGKLVLELGNN